MGIKESVRNFFDDPVWQHRILILSIWLFGLVCADLIVGLSSGTFISDVPSHIRITPN